VQPAGIATLAKTPVSDEEIQLRKRARRRLVGAIALVLIAVVVLPMVLDREPQQHPQNVNIQIPPLPAQIPSADNVTAPPSAPTAPGADAPAPQPGAETAPGASAAPSRPAEPASGAASPPAALPKPPAAASVSAAAGGETLVIQIGCFSDATKVRSLLSRIRAADIPAFSEPPPGRDRSCTRVRAGPFASQDAAQSARGRLLKLNLVPPPGEGKIVRRGD
jgi:DedD protein